MGRWKHNPEEAKERLVANKARKLKNCTVPPNRELALGPWSEHLIGRLLRWQPASLLDATTALTPPSGLSHAWDSRHQNTCRNRAWRMKLQKPRWLPRLMRKREIFLAPGILCPCDTCCLYPMIIQDKLK